jgi:magnesium chelatase subunit H
MAATPMRVVLVTMDSHLASAAQRAARTLAKLLPGVSAAGARCLEWGNDEHAPSRCQADIEQGDIVIVTMLFMEDHFLPVLPALPRAASTATPWSAPCRPLR